MGSILSILGGAAKIIGGIVSIGTWFISLFTKWQIEKAEDQKIQNATLKGELADVKTELDARAAVHDDPVSVRDDPDNYATHPTH